MKSVLALDQGTTGSTALVIAEDGRLLGRGYREIRQHFPRPGWVEHDPMDLWESTVAAARDAVAAAGTTPVAIGVTNQRETVVVWDRQSGRPLHRAIVWQDRRTAERCRQLRGELGDEWLARRTGLTWDPYFSGTKIEWLQQYDRDLAAALRSGRAALGTVDSWITSRLTGGRLHVTDHTNASRTMLYDIGQLDWSQELLDLFGVARDSLPEIVGSSAILARSDANAIGFSAPVCGIAGDQQAALFGQGGWEPGRAKCTYGTGAFLLLPLAARPECGGTGVLTTIACGPTGEPIWAFEGSVFIAGAAVQWLRDGLGLVASAGETEQLARSVENTGGVYFVPAFVGLGAPHWEAEARGTIVGITRGSTRAHLVRATLESMAYSTRELLDSVRAIPGVQLDEVRVDGGAAANDWLMQFQSDVLQVPVRRPDMVETTALGAAGLAGLAAGVWGSAPEFAGTRHYTDFAPNAVRDAEFSGWRRAIDAALHWARNPLEGLR